MQQFVEGVKRALNAPTIITLVTHRNPDGDAIGSMLAMWHMLRKFGHTVYMTCPSTHPSVFDWMPGVEHVVIYDHDQDEALDRIKSATYVMALDFNALDRVDKLGKFIFEEDKEVIMIDHHIEPEPIGDLMWSDPNASSTAEMVYRFFEAAGWKNELDLDIAKAIYTGLITDTGSFRHATTSDTYRIAGELKSLGLDDNDIQVKVFDNMTENQLRLLGHCLANRLEVLEEYYTGIIALTKQDYIDFNIQRGDTEGIVNYILKMPRLKIAALITEQPKLVKLSLRSKGNVSVQKIASEHFNGGGHFNASGGAMFKPLDVVIKKFKRVLPEYVNT